MGCEVYVATRSERERESARALGAAWTGAYDDRPPEPLDAAITFAPAGDVVVAALAAVDRGGRVVVNAIHLDRLPEMSYDLLWWERSLRSVANVTRADAAEFLELAAEIPVRTAVEPHPLEDANVALARLCGRRGAGRGRADRAPLTPRRAPARQSPPEAFLMASPIAFLSPSPTAGAQPLAATATAAISSVTMTTTPTYSTVPWPRRSSRARASADTAAACSQASIACPIVLSPWSVVRGAGIVRPAAVAARRAGAP